MKALVKDRYGSPDVLRFEEIDRPTPTDEGVLVRVRAMALNAHDWHMLRGKPYLARLTEGFRAPKERQLGLDLAGVVEAVGANVTHVKPGDSVFGSRYGAFAEYVSGKSMVPIPDGLTFEQAAAIPTAGQTALQGLRDHGAVQPGQRVLINGAGGGVGTFAVQIAKAFGAEVTAVTGPKSLDTVRSIGADTVLDYTRDDFTRGKQRYDLVLDVGGTRRAVGNAPRADPGRESGHGRSAARPVDRPGRPRRGRRHHHAPGPQAGARLPGPGQPGGPARVEGARRGWQGHARHRPRLPLRPASRCDPLPRVWGGKRQGRHHALRRHLTDPIGIATLTDP